MNSMYTSDRYICELHARKPASQYEKSHGIRVVGCDQNKSLTKCGIYIYHWLKFSLDGWFSKAKNYTFRFITLDPFSILLHKNG